MATVKTQTPLMLGENYIYPLTTADQVILADGTRLMKNGKITADDSFKLGGKDVSEYATHDDVNNAITEAISGFDHSKYATHDDVAQAITDALNNIQNASGVNF